MPSRKWQKFSPRKSTLRSNALDKKILKSEAESIAKEVFEEHKSESIPVNPIRIAESKGITVLPNESETSGALGFLMYAGGNFGIGYSTRIKNQGLIHFTIAHELGHYCLPDHPEKLFPDGKDGCHQSGEAFSSTQDYEVQADFFAAALLMPEDRFRKEINASSVGLPTLKRLAGDVFGTSLLSTARRYIEFSENRCAMVVSRGDQILYGFLSDPLKTIITNADDRYLKEKRLPKLSATALFNKDASNVTEAREREGSSSLCLWFENARDLEMSEDVIGLGRYGKTLTLLFEEE